MIFVISFLIGFFSGLLYFFHLYKSIKESILKGKKRLNFFTRFVFLGLTASTVAFIFKYGIILFLIGFYISRIFFQYIIYKKSVVI